MAIERARRRPHITLQIPAHSVPKSGRVFVARSSLAAGKLTEARGAASPLATSYDAVVCESGSLFDDRRKLRQLNTRQSVRRAARPMVKPVRTFHVETENPVAQDLSVHAAALRRLASIHPLSDRRPRPSSASPNFTAPGIVRILRVILNQKARRSGILNALPSRAFGIVRNGSAGRRLETCRGRLDAGRRKRRVRGQAPTSRNAPDRRTPLGRLGRDMERKDGGSDQSHHHSYLEGSYGQSGVSRGQTTSQSCAL